MSKKQKITYVVTVLVSIAVCMIMIGFGNKVATASLPVPNIPSGAEIPFTQQVAEDRIAGHSYIAKFGANPVMAEGSIPEDIWEVGGEYTFSPEGVFPDVGVADIISISGSNVLDVQSVLVFGLDKDGHAVTQLAVLQGQTRVALNVPLWRVHRVENWDSASFIGDVYIYSGTENTLGIPSGASVIKAKVVDGNNQTQMAIFTIPVNQVGFLYRSEVGFGFTGLPSSGSEEVLFQAQARLYGQVFKTKKEVSLVSTASSTHVDMRPFPDPLPALTDLKLQSTMASEDVHTWGTFHILLVDQNRLPPSFLASINQP